MNNGSGPAGQAGEQVEQVNSKSSEPVGRTGQLSAQHDQAAELGHRTWVFPAGRIPTTSTGAEPEFTSREELCLLNPGPQDVTAEVEVLLADGEPLGPFTLEVAGRRVRHVRINDLFDPVPVPLGVPYGMIVRTARPVVAQVVRTDTRREVLTVTTMDGYGTG